jgi:hypothetical protein
LKFRKLKIINYAFFLTLIFIINDLIEDVALANSRSVVVYHVNNNQGIDFIDGNQNTFLANGGLIENQKKIDFHIKTNWAHRDLRNTKFIASDAKLLDTVLMDTKLKLIDAYSDFYHCRMVRIGADFIVAYPDEKMKVDYVVISNNSRAKLKDLYLLYGFKSVIVDGSNSYWNRNRIIDEAKQLHLPLINTNEGAFIKNL